MGNDIAPVIDVYRNAAGLGLSDSFQKFEEKSLGDFLGASDINPATLIESSKTLLDLTFAHLLDILGRRDSASYIREAFRDGSHVLDDWLQYVKPPKPHDDSTYFKRVEPDNLSYRRFFNVVFKEGADHIAVVTAADLSRPVGGLTNEQYEPFFVALEGIDHWKFYLAYLGDLKKRRLAVEARSYSLTAKSSSPVRSRGRLQYNHVRPGVSRCGDGHD